MKILYRGQWLAKGSKALELYEDMMKAKNTKDQKLNKKLLDEHIDVVERNAKELVKKYER